MEDRLENGGKIRTLNTIDDYNKEILDIDINYNFPAKKVIKTMKEMIRWRGKLEQIRSNYGTEFTATLLMAFTVNSHHTPQNLKRKFM